VKQKSAVVIWQCGAWVCLYLKTCLCYQGILNSHVNYRIKWHVCMSTEVL